MDAWTKLTLNRPIQDLGHQVPITCFRSQNFLKTLKGEKKTSQKVHPTSKSSSDTQRAIHFNEILLESFLKEG